MKVLVDATMLDGGPSGAATRLASLGGALAARGRVQVVHLVRPGLSPLPGLAMHAAGGLATPLGRALSGRRLAALANETGADLVHCGALPLPRLAGLPLAFTLHDLRYVLPGTPGATDADVSPFRRAWSRRALPRQLARPGLFACVSEWTARGLAGTGLVPAGRIVVVPNAATPGLARVEDLDRLGAFRRRLGLNARYALAIGPLARHKRVGFLLEALAAARARPGGRDLGLVFAGRADRPTLAAVARRAQSLGCGEAVRVTDVLPAEELACALSAADALVVAGRVEGFSIPVVDAQGLGLPVVAVRAGALPEVAGEDGAWLAPPEDAAAFGAALVAAVTLGPERDARLARARELSARWSWDRSAQVLEAAWSQLIGRN